MSLRANSRNTGAVVTADKMRKGLVQGLTTGDERLDPMVQQMNQALGMLEDRLARLEEQVAILRGTPR